MPYSNIVFIKLFLDLFDQNDRFLYQLNESQQLLFIKLLYLAGRTENEIPKNIKFLCHKINYNHDGNCFLSDIKRIQDVFPKFIEKEDYYYFKNFNELHNYIGKRKSKGNPKEFQRIAPEKEEEKEEEKEKIEKDFNSLWDIYPIKEGKKQSFFYYKASLKAGDKHSEIKQALENYLNKIKVENTGTKYIKHGKTFFNNWKDYLNYNVKPKPLSKSDIPYTKPAYRE